MQKRHLWFYKCSTQPAWLRIFVESRQCFLSMEVSVQNDLTCFSAPTLEVNELNAHFALSFFSGNMSRLITKIFLSLLLVVWITFNIQTCSVYYKVIHIELEKEIHIFSESVRLQSVMFCADSQGETKKVFFIHDITYKVTEMITSHMLINTYTVMYNITLTTNTCIIKKSFL